MRRIAILLGGMAFGLPFVVGAADVVQWPALPSGLQPVYDAIFEPQTVAVPPDDAPGAFSVSAEGELRCFGTWMRGSARQRMTLASSDWGLNWRLRPRTADDAVYVPCPWAAYEINVVGPGEWADFGLAGAEGKVGRCWIRTRDAQGQERVRSVGVPGLTRCGKLRALPLRRRWTYAFNREFKDRIGNYPCLVHSDDDGATWSEVVEVRDALSVAEVTAPDQAPRWDVGCNEPDLIELKDGTVLMVARTGTDRHAFYTSTDGGFTWSKPFVNPAFWSSNTMPLLKRLSDGRILFVWNNTQILPKRAAFETPELNRDERRGRWESVFTNRDALHAAISEDEGKTWIGFREIALNEIRNREDYREVGNEFGKMRAGLGIDKSVHQSAAVELPGGKVAILYGQNAAARRIAIFDLKWLYERGRTEDLRLGTVNLSNHLYLRSLLGAYRGWSGHCSLNRVPGAAMVREPGTDAETRRECLQICRIRDERLVDDRQGVVWNFPAARKGRVAFECRIDGRGVLVSLCDHWVNPCDWAIASRAAFASPLEAGDLGGPGQWRTVTLDWDCDAETVVVSCAGNRRTLPLKTEGFSPFGLSYLHLQTRADGHDPKGAYFRWFKMSAVD